MITMKELAGALQWLVDDLSDSGEDRNPNTGEIYDSVQSALATLSKLKDVDCTQDQLFSVAARGEANLRNGWSIVTRLLVQFAASTKSAEISVVNSRGQITHGGILLPRAAVLDIAHQIIYGCPTRVRVEVRGGVASVESCPSWVDIEIVDHDVREGEGD